MLLCRNSTAPLSEVKPGTMALYQLFSQLSIQEMRNEQSCKCLGRSDSELPRYSHLEASPFTNFSHCRRKWLAFLPTFPGERLSLPRKRRSKASDAPQRKPAFSRSSREFDPFSRSQVLSDVRRQLDERGVFRSILNMLLTRFWPRYRFQVTH